MSKTTLGSNIKVLRASVNMTGQEFADLFKIKRGSVESYEQGRAIPKAPFIQAVCTYYSITQDQLLKQKLTEEDLKVTGRIRSILEIENESLKRENDLLRNTVRDLRQIIAMKDLK